MKNVVMLVHNDVSHDTRVKKEAETLGKNGYKVTVIGIRGTDEIPEFDSYEYYDVIRIRHIRNSYEKFRDFFLSRIKKFQSSFNKEKISNDILNSLELRDKAEKDAKEKITNTNKLSLKICYIVIAELKCIYYTKKIEKLHKSKIEFKEKYSKINLKQKENFKKYYASIYAPYMMPFAQFFDFEKLVRSKIEELKPDIIHAHDLLTTYAAVKYSKKHNIPMIYDAHEYEIHRNRKYRTFKILADQWFEWKAVKQAKRVITVSDGIAEDMAKMYNIPVPTVVLNSPTIKAIDYEVDKDIRTDLGLSNDDVILVYVGINTIGRGLEVFVKSLMHLPENYHVAILGPRKEVNDTNLIKFAQLKGVVSRVHLLEPVLPIEIPNYIKSADVSVIPGINVCKSYDYSLPNKLFDALFSTLIICSGNVKSISQFIQKNKLGEIFDGTNHKDMAKKIKNAIQNRNEYNIGKKSDKKIFEKYSWESQSQILVDLYKNL